MVKFEENPFKYLDADLSGCYFVGLKVSNIDLSNSSLIDTNLESSDLVNANFEGAILKNVNFRYSEILSCSFIDTSITKSKFEYANIHTSRFYYSKMKGVFFTRAKIIGVCFDASTIKKLHFDGAVIKESSFLGCLVTSGTSFICSKIVSSNFNGSFITNTNFQCVTFLSSKFCGTYIKDVNFEGATIHKTVIFGGGNYVLSPNLDMQEFELDRVSLLNVRINEDTVLDHEVHFGKIATNESIGQLLERMKKLGDSADDIEHIEKCLESQNRVSKKEDFTLGTLNADFIKEDLEQLLQIKETYAKILRLNRL